MKALRSLHVVVGALLLLTGVTGFVGSGVLAMAVLILSGILFSGILTRAAARPFTGVIDNIYFGTNPRDTPPLTLRLARAYRRDLRFEEAIEECERQLDYHPRSLDLWCELIHNYRESGDLKGVEHFFHKARRRLRRDDRRQLDFEFQRCLSLRG